MTADRGDILQRVSQEIFRAQGKSGEVTIQRVDTALAELGLDSLKLIEIVYELETFYQLDVDEELLAELESIGDLVSMFVATLAAKDCSNVQG